MTGCTPEFSISASISTMPGLTPENPFASALALRSIIALTTSVGYGSPTPHAWLLRRLSWSARRSFFGILELTRSPTPVLTAYIVAPLSRRASRDALDVAIRPFASLSSVTAMDSLATLTTLSTVRLLPSMTTADFFLDP